MLKGYVLSKVIDEPILNIQLKWKCSKISDIENHPETGGFFLIKVAFQHQISPYSL